jgi:SP family facilitated glucose transporter-like MFS transporter 1
MFFSTKIFKMAQLSDENAQYATLGMGSMNVVMTVISLVLVEKAGRKTLLLIGFTGMFFDTVLLAICLNYAVSSPHSWPTLQFSNMLVTCCTG